MQQVAELKKVIEEQSIITRRTIVKNAQKGDYLSLRHRWLKQEEKNKKEQYMRRKYPALGKAWKHYKTVWRLIMSEQ